MNKNSFQLPEVDFTAPKRNTNTILSDPPKVFESINCSNCHNERQFDGYIFKLVPVCAECRTEIEVQITGKRFERRRANR